MAKFLVASDFHGSLIALQKTLDLFKEHQADKLIMAIDKTLNNLTIEAIAAGREYSDYKMNQCIAVNLSNASLFSEIKTIVVFAVIAYISAMAYDLSRKFRKA